ncbi:MAG: contractile injection system tape measure protein [Draconibacterium sp.]
MTAVVNHIIDKVLVDVNLRNEKTAHSIKNSISTFLQNEVFPELESLLDELNAGNQIIRYERIAFDLQIENWEQRHQLKKELVNHLRQTIVESLGVKVPQTGERWRLDGTGKIHNTDLHGEFVGPAQNNRNTLLFFLEHAYLPWYGKRTGLEDTMEPDTWNETINDTTFHEQVISLLQKNDSALQRFVFQFPNSRLLSFLTINKNVFSDRSGVEKFLNTLSGKAQKLLIEYLLRISITSEKAVLKEKWLQLFYCFQQESIISSFRNSDKADVERINTELKTKPGKYLINAVVNRYFQITEEDIKDKTGFEREKPENPEIKRFTQPKGSIIEKGPTVISKGSVRADSEKEPLFFGNHAGEIAVRNAGQVLFHPFLKNFFEQFNWLNNKGKIKKEYRMQALQAVHFCATGTETFWEDEMILEKFLCGIPLQTPVPSFSLLTSEIKTEAGEMLQQLVGNWKALKNTSVEGMREMFFQRDGKLIQTDKNFKLIVERKAQDILLDKLPWGVSIIKLPWRGQLLFVEW